LKRIFAIVLLGIHLFNLGGYALLYRYYIHKSDVQMVKQIFDNKIDNARLVELKIPVNMPTVQDWDDYEVIEGQIQLKDAYYNYVRLKMTRDTMYFICIANETKTRLEHANIITAKEINDVPLTKKGEAPVSKKINTLSEYNLQAFTYEYIAFGANIMQTVKPASFQLSRPYIESPGKPPNFIA
jgi:hypothetical protein